MVITCGITYNNGYDLEKNLDSPTSPQGHGDSAIPFDETATADMGSTKNENSENECRTEYENVDNKPIIVLAKCNKNGKIVFRRMMNSKKMKKKINKIKVVKT